jgi:membrane-bound lytic murein transglycosylase D
MKNIYFFLDKIGCFKLKIDCMSNFRLFLLLFIILVSVSPLHAFDNEQDTNQDTKNIDQPVISTLTEIQLKNSPGIVEDYSYNELAVGAVKRHVTLFTEKMKERFSIWLIRSGKYLELMKEILKEKNVPEEIVFLPLIESGFSAYAYSPARAAGYWQFIASTAKRYGLEINWWKDERRDPVKSTVAAANYLTDLYGMFGSWNLAMAAYNAGEGKIMRALNKSKTDDYWSLLTTNHIRKETKDYVPKFIAASMIANSPKNFGFEDLELHKPMNYDIVTLKSPVDIEVIAECSETSEEVIKELNPELRRWCTPPDVSEYALRIPEGKKEVFLERFSNISEEKRFTVDIYTAKQGDTFNTISKKTGVPVQVILDLNDMEKIIPIKAGTKIYLPPKEKYTLDRDDKATAKKAAYKQKKKTKRNASGKQVRKVSFKENSKSQKAPLKKI